MGNSHSDINPFSSRKHIPKHLRPAKKKKPFKKPVCTQDRSSDDIQKKAVVFEVPAIKNSKISNDDDDDREEEEEDMAEDETILVGSGPRGAFRWFKGRRYLNYAQEGEMQTTLLPNDQIELDRLRVQSFITKWAFKSYVIAPVEDDLRAGIKVLNVGFGPGLWPGHHIIDMALDYPNSQFTAVDILDLLPEDFEEEAKELDESDTNCANNTLFTPMHPNLSTKLQNTTTPVIDSSTLDSSSYSNHILSQTDDDTTFDSSTFTAASVDVAAKIGHLFINGVAAPEVTPSLVVKRQLLKNLEFYQADVVDVGLPFPDNHFDFIKQHLVSSSFTVASWKKVMVELVRITKPGGYIQLLEIDYCTFNLGPKGRKWETQLLEATREKRHIEPRIACHLQDLLKAVGLVDVSSRLVSIPLGSWGQDLGVLWEQNVHNFSDSAAPVLSRLVGVSVSTYRRNWREMLEEVKDRKAFSNMHAAWGRKSPTGTIDWSLCPSLSQ